MNKQQLLERKTHYEMKRVEVLEKSYEEEIEAELAKERAKLEAKYDAQKQQDLSKIDHYIELLTDLAIEESKEEALRASLEFEESSSQSVEVSE